MDTQQVAQAGLNCTPKAHRSAGSGGSDSPSSSSQSQLSNLKQHPEDDPMLLSPAISYLARKSSQLRGPPALSAKPRKSNSLFGNREDDEDGQSNPRDTIKSFLTTGKRSDDGGARIERTSTASFVDEDPADVRQKSSFCDTLNTTTTSVSGGGGGHDEQTQTRGFNSASSWAGAKGSFSSPSRPTVTSADRFTPQRNLGGLFLSPCRSSGGRSASEVNDDIAASVSPHTWGIAVPINCDMHLKSRLPKQEENEEEEEEEAEGSTRSAVPAGAVAAEPAASGAVVTEPSAHLSFSVGDGAVILEPAVVARGEKESAAGGSVTAAPMDEVLVSNEAFNAADTKDICTLEVLVRHTRDRVGVSALSSWRVAELKRRLVYLNIFPSVETISLKPRFMDQALADDQTLDTLDTDMTYEARKLPFQLPDGIVGV